MIHTRAKTLLSKTVLVYDGDLPLGRLRFSGLGAGGGYTVFDDAFRVEPVKRLGREYIASIGHSVLGRAERQGFFASRFDLQLGRIGYVLAGRRPGLRTMVLSELGREVMRIEREGRFTRRARIEGPQPLDTEHLMFVLWLFHKEIRRGRRS